MKSIYFILSSILLVSSHSFASPLVGKVIRAEGDAHLLNNGSTTPKGPQPRLKYQGKYFTFQPIKIGASFRPGDIIHTSPNGRARVAFSNGDQITVGPSTSYQNNAQSADESETNIMHLFYGKIRSFISKRKSNDRIKVKTSTVTAGVRGTDFYMSHHPTKGTEVTVLRGLIDVRSENSESAQIKAGQTAQIELKQTSEDIVSSMKSSEEVKDKSTKDKQIQSSIEKQSSSEKMSSDKQSSEKVSSDKQPPNATKSTNSLTGLDDENEDYLKPQRESSLKVVETQKSSLDYIQEKTSVKPIDSAEQLSQLLQLDKASAESQFKEIKSLEEKSIAKTIEDIKSYSKESASKIGSVNNIDELNSKTISDLKKNAPNNEILKPKKDELDQLGKDSYDKYYKKK